MPNYNQRQKLLLNSIKAVVGDKGWVEGSNKPHYFDDPRGRFAGTECFVVFPNSTEQVAEVVRLCNTEGIGVIPYGGGTGVVAGQLSLNSDNNIILSLERMNKVRSFMADDYAMTVEAGCILENIHKTATENNLTFPLSMASKGSCTIGGNLATNAGGIQVVRYGNARDLCLGIEAVLPSGEVLNELNPLRKNNTGYDLRHLLIGSEGTLGIITAATLDLKPMDAETVTALCAIKSTKDALSLYGKIRNRIGSNISGLELMSELGLSLVQDHFPDLHNPIVNKVDWYLLLEVTGYSGILTEVEAALADCMEQDILLDAVIASSARQRSDLWALRENMPEANRLTGAICNSDTSVPISKIEEFIANTHDAVSKIFPGLRVNSYGHIGDGNIHHNVFPPAQISKKEFLKTNPDVIETVRTTIHEETVKLDGAISAEHGIGRLKTEDFKVHSSDTKLNMIRQIKSSLDPNNIMNPGAVLD